MHKVREGCFNQQPESDGHCTFTETDPSGKEHCRIVPKTPDGRCDGCGVFDADVDKCELAVIHKPGLTAADPQVLERCAFYGGAGDCEKWAEYECGMLPPQFLPKPPPLASPPPPPPPQASSPPPQLSPVAPSSGGLADAELTLVGEVEEHPTSALLFGFATFFCCAGICVLCAKYLLFDRRSAPLMAPPRTGLAAKDGAATSSRDTNVELATPTTRSDDPVDV